MCVCVCVCMCVSIYIHSNNVYLKLTTTSPHGYKNTPSWIILVLCKYVYTDSCYSPFK